MHDKDLRSEEEKKKAEEEKKEDDPEYEPLYVQRAKSKAERQREFASKAPAADSGKAQSGVNLYVKNLDETMTDDELKTIFEKFGEVTSCVAMKDDRGKCKGFGFISFSAADDATKAVTEMHLKVVSGKPLYVGLAEKKEDRAERLRNRYTAGGMSGKGKGGKGGMGGMGGMQPQMGMGGPMMGNPMMGKGGPMMGGPMGQMGGKGPMMGNPMMGGPRPMMGQGGTQ